MKRSMILASFALMALTACNSLELVPVAMKATLQGTSMRVVIDKDNPGKYTVEQQNGEVVFNVLAGSAGLNLEGFSVVAYDQSQAKLGEQTFPLNVKVPGSPDKNAEVKVTLTDFFLPLAAKTKLEQSCLVNYSLGENCPPVNVQVTFYGTSTANNQPKQIPLNFVFQAEASNQPSNP